MSNTNASGQAFPFVYDNQIEDKRHVFLGMTLRDYFAAKAMQCYMDDEIWTNDTYKLAAKASYAVADAMLKARGE